MESSPLVELTPPSTQAPLHTRKLLQLGDQFGPIVIACFSPLTTTFPSSYYWGINQSITYGTTTILSETAGIIDTDNTLILIATSAYLEPSE
jgi:hypothetical protein